MSGDRITVVEALAAHRSWLAMRRSSGTAAKYEQLLKPFGDEYGERFLETLTASDLELGYLAQFSHLSAASQRNRLSALKSLYECAERFDWITSNPTRKLDAPPRDDRMKPWLRPSQDEAVLACAFRPQAQLIVFLLRFTGLRVSEACALKWADVDLKNGHLTVHKSKTASGRRVIPLPPLLVPILTYAVKQGDYVLSTRHGTAMKPQHVWRIVRRVGEAAGIQGLHPHTLRRTYGSTLINDGVRLEVVSKLLGHSSTTVTEKSYAELTDETIAREAMAVWTA